MKLRLAFYGLWGGSTWGTPVARSLSEDDGGKCADRPPRVSESVANPSIVTGGDQVGTVRKCRFQKQFKLDLLVAHDVRIRRAAGLVLVNHIVDNFVPVLLFEIVHFERNAELHCHAFG